MTRMLAPSCYVRQATGVQPETEASSALVSIFVAGSTVALFLLVSEACRHWFVIPVFACGCLIGTHAVDWVRGRLSLFDPKGLLGAYGLHFFFLAPLLHNHWDYWMAYVVPPSDWREWLGCMACFNFVGILIYFAVLRQIAAHYPRRSETVWCFDYLSFFPILTLAALVSLGLQVWVLVRFNGISGFVEAFNEQCSGGDGDGFRNLGLVFTLSEAFPVLAFLGYAVAVARDGRRLSWKVLALVLLAFLAAKVLFGGLRGSRANYVWPLFWAVGVIHLKLRPVSRRTVFAGVALLLAFMYAYGFYKTFGGDALEALEGIAVREEMVEQSKRGFDAVLLGDFGRADVQALIFSRLWGSESDSDFSHGWGRTYVGAACLLVPSWLWPDRPMTKVKEGTDALYGRGGKTHVSGVETASNAYGLAGEAMLNFGPLAIPLSFAFLGLVVGWIRSWAASLDRHDSRQFLVPFVVSLCFFVLVWDSDVTLFYFITHGAPLLFVVFLSSRKSVRPRQGAAVPALVQGRAAGGSPYRRRKAQEGVA